MTLVTAVLLTVFSAAVPAQRNLTGEWVVKLTGAGGTPMPDLACKLTQKGQQLNGTCRAAANERAGALNIAGKVTGNKINCQWKVPAPDGGSWSFVLNGTSNARRGEIKGTFKVSFSAGGGTEGTFVAVRK